MASKLVGFLQNCEIKGEGYARKFRKGEMITLPDEFIVILQAKVPGVVVNLTPSPLAVAVRATLSVLAVPRRPLVSRGPRPSKAVNVTNVTS